MTVLDEQTKKDMAVEVTSKVLDVSEEEATELVEKKTPEQCADIITGFLTAMLETGVINQECFDTLCKMITEYGQVLVAECAKQYPKDFIKLVNINNGLAKLLQEQTDIVNSVIGE